MKSQGRRQPSRSAFPLPSWSLSLRLLFEAAMAAQAEGRDPWQFAVEIRQLVSAGLSHTDLRRLLCQGMVQAAEEVLGPCGRERTFRRSASLCLTEQTCFVLTPAGEAALRRAWAGPSSSAAANGATGNDVATPHWDRTRRTLSWGGQLVKRFSGPAPNQERILDAFAEDGWPVHLDDPLPGRDEQVAKQRLHDAIKNLNRHQVARLLHFAGDGTGKGIVWRALDERELS